MPIWRFWKQRIAQRNRSFEHHIEDDYLLNLKEDYLTFYNAMKSEGANVVLINTSEIDFVKMTQIINQF